MEGFDPAATTSWVMMFGLLMFALWRLQRVKPQSMKRGDRKSPRF